MDKEPVRQLLGQAFPFWGVLAEAEKKLLAENTMLHSYQKGEQLYYGGNECAGLEIVRRGRVRVFMNSPNGGEITLYRLLERDICILSAACLIKSLNFEIHMEFEEDTELCVVKSGVYHMLGEKNSAVKDFTPELVSSRFSDVMWLMNQLVFSNMGERLAQSLLEQARLGQGDVLHITHDTLARDLGTAREVVTRLLRQFQMDGLVSLSRGNIRLLDTKRLESL